MKQYGIIFTISLSFLICCCNKDDEHLLDWSKITAQKNGELWTTQAAALIHNIENVQQLSISANVKNEYGELREELFIGNNPFELGKHKLSRRNDLSKIDNSYSSYTTFSDDGDVVEDRFIVFDNEFNYINFTTIDTVNMKLSGSFKVTFIRDVNDPIDNASLPDTIRFIDGEFCIKIMDTR